ncbi:MAG: type IX secretion system sortase PorU [Paludibacter sp.]|nr:type IX secretion system sortase PorU [Paludibacter sp.]
MKYKVIFFAILLISFTTLQAQTTQISSHNINWKGVEKWYADSSSINVISFDGAQYPAENHLPYFNERIKIDPAFSYRAELLNAVYIPVTKEDSALLTANVALAANAEVLTNLFQLQGSTLLDISILPFVNQNGKLLKLLSFDLQIDQNNQPQKIIAATSHTYASNSVLAQGKFVKIQIINSGIYKLTYEDLVSMGVNPANVRIFGYGGGVLDQDFSHTKIDDLPEDAIYMNKGADGIFNAGDYILFYAQGIVKWSYDKTKSMFTHTANTYSKYGYYFVTSDAGSGNKIDIKSIPLPNSPTINVVNEFTDYQVYEKDLQNLVKSGKEFYGETFNDVTSYTLPFSFPNSIQTNSTVARLDVAASSPVPSSFSLNLNGAQTKSISVSQIMPGDNFTMANGNSAIYTFTPLSDTFNFNISYTKPAGTSIGYLNYLEVNVRRQLTMSGSVMQFQNVDYLGQSVYSQYELSGANSNVQIWDITDPQNIYQIQTTIVNGKMTFIDSSTNVKTYLAIDPTLSSSFSKPDIVGVVPNQNLHGVAQADMVIITNPLFLSQAESLAQAHRDKDNLTVEVVTTDQVYNEFSSGAPDATAYRWVMKMLYDRALALGNTADLPKYLLLFGRGSYDNRKIRPDSGDNLILTYQADNSLVMTSAYVTDDYFALLGDNDGVNISSNLMDIGVGRFPVSNVQQATDIVNKTITYMNNKGKGYWKNQLCFLADDGAVGDGSRFGYEADNIAISLNNSSPAYQIEKIYLDAYLEVTSASGLSSPDAKMKLLNSIQSGLLLLDYTGHAGPYGLTSKSVLSLADVKVLSNPNLFFFIGATCDFLQFDVQATSGGEQLLTNPLGGAIGVFSSARPVYESQNFTLNKAICDNLFLKKNGTEQRIGDIISLAKNIIGNQINKLPYIYMGDPALKLNYPTNYQILTSKLNESTTFGSDTLRALSVDTIQGYIADANGNKVDNFNGTLHAEIYDKVQSITTLNNAGNGAFTYLDRPNTLFSGNVVVKNGVFSFSFMLPKDIKYNFGGGRINYYAEDDTNNFEAQGYFENFIIGGTSKNYTDETVGPTVGLYLNSENFVSGDKVNETPLLIANVSDTDGINTVGSGIGHDITMTIDQDPSQSYILDDYFQSAPNSYTSGVVNYKLSALPNGKHSLTFKVWDLLNNSTSSSINFEVVKGLSPVIFSIYNYPNPVKSQTNIIVKNDRPETILSTTVEIFDISGRKIWSFSQSSADNISWNLLTNDGQRVRNGIYLYRVSIKTTNSDITSKTNKMMVIEQ